MSEFAQIDGAGVVLQIIVAEADFIQSGAVGDPTTWLSVVPEGSAGVGYSWSIDLGLFVPPGGFPGPSVVLEAKAQLRELIDAATSPILDAYPRAEQLSWDAKETEAAAFMAAEDPVPADYALLRGEVSAELLIPAGDVTLEQLGTKAEAVLWMASQWRALVSLLSGLRKRTEAQIDAAEDAAGRRAAVDAARATIMAVTA
jgi:hypothetical protein